MTHDTLWVKAHIFFFHKGAKKMHQVIKKNTIKRGKCKSYIEHRLNRSNLDNYLLVFGKFQSSTVTNQAQLCNQKRHLKK